MMRETDIPYILTRFREDNGYTQQQLGVLLDCSRSFVSRMETGDYVPAQSKNPESLWARIEGLGYDPQPYLPPVDDLYSHITDLVAERTRLTTLGHRVLNRIHWIDAELEERRTDLANREQAQAPVLLTH